MSNIKTVEERKKKYFPYNTFERASQDVVLVYPKNKTAIGLNWLDTVDALQRIVDFLADITGLKLEGGLNLEDEGERFDKIVVVGYRRNEDLVSNECNPSWVSDNTTKLPWDCLQIENKTITSCTHELVHPFLKIFFHKSKSLRRREENEINWGDGFCDFLRIFIIDFLDMDLKEQINGKEYNWKEDSFEGYMRSTEKTGESWKTHHKPALQLLSQFRKYRWADGYREKSEIEVLKVFLQALSSKEDLEKEITEDYHNIL